MGGRLRIALLQLLARDSKSKILQRTEEYISQAADNGTKLAILPELFTTELHPPVFMEKKENVPDGETCQAMSHLAKKYNMHIVAGSVAEQITGSEKMKNTSIIFNPKGELVGKYTKMHSFDVDLGERLSIHESEWFEHGNSPTTFKTDICKVGVGICIDIRFPEISRYFTEQGCNLHVYLGAFSAARTGPAHWDVLARARAIDNQVYLAACSPARDDSHHYVAWGHSVVVDPWGKIISQAESEESMIYADLDMNYLNEMREQLPVEEIRRKDLYHTTYNWE
ncbi:omega-amidase NIT2-like isoform X1 [Ostrea edulis]|uniref:omega-amidase NIT2-like isoform X1 n=1 Tax=Ostrea edulis TaxID=37623 RepID=UPI002095B0FC|nr:omega-amidase NIT2-like isoform X1 [Ostrea edulis]